ncbi:putative ribonuclease H-like domain-containing protein [Tanacetum coccineum]
MAWTTVNLVHAMLTYQFFHWKKGTPFADDQGIYNRLTWWEQIDSGKQLTRNRKFLTLVPVVLLLSKKQNCTAMSSAEAEYVALSASCAQLGDDVGRLHDELLRLDTRLKCCLSPCGVAGSQITDKRKKGLGYSAVPPAHPLIYNRPNKLDLSYSGLDEFKEPEFKGYGTENSKLESNIVCDKKSDDSKENSDDSLVKEQVSEDTSSFVESPLNVDKETIFLVDKKIEFVKPKNHEKPVKKSVRYAEMYRSQSPRGNQRNWNGQKSNQLGSDFVMYNKACFICGSFDHVQINCNYHQRERMVSRNNYNRVDYDYYAKTTHPSAHRNMTPRAVLLKTGLTPLNTVRPVNTAHPKPAVHSAKSMSHFSKQAQSTDQRPFHKKTTLTSRYVNQKLNTAMRHYHTERPRGVNTARSYTTPVNAVRAKRVNAVKTSAC